MNGIRKVYLMIDLEQPNKQGVHFRRFIPRLKYRGSGISVSIILDLALILISIFLLLSPVLVKPGIQIDLPVSNFTQGENIYSDIVSITRNGNIYYDDELMSLESLEEKLSILSKKQTNSVVIIESDRNVTHGRLVDVWSVIQKSGVQSISLATGLKSKGIIK